MARSVPSGRVVTIMAVGFLALDGVLLILAGVWSGRTSLAFWGAVLIAMGVGVVVYWRRHLRRMQELREALRLRDIEFERIRQDLENRAP